VGGKRSRKRREEEERRTRERVEEEGAHSRLLIRHYRFAYPIFLYNRPICIQSPLYATTRPSADSLRNRRNCRACSRRGETITISGASRVDVISTSTTADYRFLRLHLCIRLRKMLAEVLLVLSGHPSAFFTPYPPAQPTTLRISPELEKYLHPGETSSLNTLGSLAWHYTRIRQWSKTTIANAQTSILDLNRAKGKQRETGQGDVYLSALAHGITTVLGGYEAAIVELETKVLEMDEGVVQDLQGHVPLSIIVATFSPWFAPLHSLSDLVDVLSRDSPTPGQLMEMLGELSDTGNPELERIYGRLLTTLESLFVTHLTTFVLFGQAPTTTSRAMPAFALDVGPDALSPRHRTYALNGDLLPRSIGAKSRESMLYVGRVSATLRREGRELPRSMVDALRKAFDGVVVLDDEAGVRSRGLEGLDEAIGMARREVGEWLWRYVLTGSQVIDALETL